MGGEKQSGATQGGEDAGEWEAGIPGGAGWGSVPPTRLSPLPSMTFCLIKFGRISNKTLSSLYFPTDRSLALLETSTQGTN